MRLKLNTDNAIVVKKSWARLHAIQLFLHDSTADEIEFPDDSHIIFAHVLDDSDERGLWIELKTKERKQDPAADRPVMLIPWNAVLSIVIANDFAEKIEQAQKLKGNSTST